MTILATGLFSGIADGTKLGSVAGWVTEAGSTQDLNVNGLITGGVLRTYTSYGNTAAWSFNVGDADQRVQYTIQSAGATRSESVNLRWVDSANYIQVQSKYINATTSALYVKTVIAGVSTTRASVVVTRAVGDVIRWELTGTKVKGYQNGNEKTPAGGVDVSAFTGSSTKLVLDSLAQEYFGALQIENTSVASESISLAALSPVYQRDVAGTRSIPISGACSSVTGIQFRITQGGVALSGFDWQAPSNVTINGATGQWSATVPAVPQGGKATPYVLQVRSATNTAIVSEARNFSVGIILGGYGQSNAVGMGNSASVATVVASPGAWVQRNAGTFEQINNSVAQLVANTVADAAGLPVMFINAGQGGASSTVLLPGGTAWTDFEAKLAAAGGGLEFWLYNQGEAGPFSSTWTADLSTMLARLLTLSGRTSQTMRTLVVGLGRFRNGTGLMSASYNTVRALQKEFAAANNGLLALTTFDLEPQSGDPTYHFSPLGYEVMGKRMAQSILNALGLATADGAGPKITGATMSGATIVLTVAMRGAMSLAKATAAAASGFQASSDGFATQLTINDVQISGSTVILTLASAPTSSVTVRHLFDEDTLGSNWIRGTGYSIGDIVLQGDQVIAGGPSSGSLTSSTLKNNTGTAIASVPFEAFVSNPTAGTLVVKKTGLTSNGSGVIGFTDGALVSGTSYRVVWRRTDTGAEGLETLTAT